MKMTVDEKLEQIADEVAFNHSKIYDRRDLHQVALLTWLCPIGFMFPGETEIQRGWLNTLVIGDTQTGKSQVIATLQRLTKLGDIVNGENCTYVGLVGGAIKGNTGYMLRWGRIPLCDRKLVVIEELSGLNIREISNMSEVRSRGIARIDKGGLNLSTTARTRLLMLSNARPTSKTLSQYLSGVQAVQELIGHPEDISRFDLILTLIDSEVKSNVINTTENETVKTTFSPSQLQHLCQFIWSLKPDQIRISTGAYIRCLEWTEKLQEIYHPSFPVFKAASGRLLLARIGTAIACSQFCWNGEYITVGEDHIDAAVNLLRNLYDKPSFGYLEYSQRMWDRETVRALPELELELKRNIKESVVDIFDQLIHLGKFTQDEFAAIASIETFQANRLIGCFLRARIIRKGEVNIWELTKAGRDWMIKMIKERIHERNN